MYGIAVLCDNVLTCLASYKNCFAKCDAISVKKPCARPVKQLIRPRRGCMGHSLILEFWLLHRSLSRWCSIATEKCMLQLRTHLPYPLHLCPHDLQAVLWLCLLYVQPGFVVLLSVRNQIRFTRKYTCTTSKSNHGGLLDPCLNS